MKNLFVILLLAGLLSCTNSNEATLPAGEWALIKLNGEDASAFKRPVTLTLDTAESKASGFAGCNRYFSSYRAKESGIHFTDIGSTKMFCENVMDVENKFLETLSNVESFKLTGNNLQFLKGDSVLLEFKQ